MGVIPPGTKLTERTADLPAWDSLKPEEKKLYARQMEVFAAMLEHVDAQIGRILDAVEELGIAENTLLIIMADNGPMTHNPPPGLGMGEGMFRGGKGDFLEGGVRVPGIAWWPGMDRDIEQMVNGCDVCQRNRGMPVSAPLNPCEFPSKPWSRIHVDYAGPYLNTMFLVVIDAHSKWMDVFDVKSATGSQTVEKLRMSFATHGVSETIVSDNASQFVNEVFAEFTRKNQIKDIRVSPYHPSSNGLAERAVQVFKNGMKVFTEGDIKMRLARS